MNTKSGLRYGIKIGFWILLFQTFFLLLSQFAPFYIKNQSFPPIEPSILAEVIDAIGGWVLFLIAIPFLRKILVKRIAGGNNLNDSIFGFATGYSFIFFIAITFINPFIRTFGYSILKGDTEITRIFQFVLASFTSLVPVPFGGRIFYIFPAILIGLLVYTIGRFSFDSNDKWKRLYI